MAPNPRPHLRRELLAQGIPDSTIRGALRTGTLIPLARGAYLEAADDAALERVQRYRLRVGAVAGHTPEQVISHASAVAWHRLPLNGLDLDRVHLTRPGHGGNATSRDRVVHAGHVPDTMRTVVDGLCVTTVARTLVDLARCAPLESVVAAGDAALQRELVGGAEITEALEAARHCGGRANATRALNLLDGRSESPGESRLRLILQESPLPPPAVQVEVFDDRGRFAGRTDFGYPDLGVLIEFDGLVKYQKLLRPGESPSDAVVREKRREERITELGWLVLRFIWADLRNRAAIRERVRRACLARRELVASGAIRGHVVPTPALS